MESVKLLHDGSYIRVDFCICSISKVGTHCDHIGKHIVSTGRPVEGLEVEDFLSEIRELII